LSVVLFPISHKNAKAIDEIDLLLCWHSGTWVPDKQTRCKYLLDIFGLPVPHKYVHLLFCQIERRARPAATHNYAGCFIHRPNETLLNAQFGEGIQHDTIIIYRVTSPRPASISGGGRPSCWNENELNAAPSKPMLATSWQSRITSNPNAPNPLFDHAPKVLKISDDGHSPPKTTLKEMMIHLPDRLSQFI